MERKVPTPPQRPSTAYGRANTAGGFGSCFKEVRWTKYQAQASVNRCKVQTSTYTIQPAIPVDVGCQDRPTDRYALSLHRRIPGTIPYASAQSAIRIGIFTWHRLILQQSDSVGHVQQAVGCRADQDTYAFTRDWKRSCPLDRQPTGQCAVDPHFRAIPAKSATTISIETKSRRGTV